MGDTSLSKTMVQELVGRPPPKVWDEWLSYGLIPPPNEDGRFEVGVDELLLRRIETAKRLAPHARALARRALWLHNEGFTVEAEARRRAVIEVLYRIRPPQAKMTRIRQELDALARQASVSPVRQPRTFGLGIASSHWPRIVKLVDWDTFESRSAQAARYADWLPRIADSAGLPEWPIPFDERVALVLVNLLLLHEEPVREAFGLPSRARTGLDIQP